MLGLDGIATQDNQKQINEWMGPAKSGLGWSLRSLGDDVSGRSAAEPHPEGA